MTRTEAIAIADRHPAPSPSFTISPVILTDATPGIVHDLGNLIQVASSALNIISRSPPVEANLVLEPVIASARTALGRAEILVQQTLRRAREGNAITESVSVKACLMEIKSIVEHTWTHGIRIDLEASPDLPPVRCGYAGLQNAVMNLLLNARDAMPNGGRISMTAAAIRQGLAVREIEVVVTDTGVGMSPETTLRAADPFFTTKTTGLGGLGLSMVKRFLDEAGGRLSIESKPGGGTTVTLRLPVWVSAPQPEAVGRPALLPVVALQAPEAVRQA